MDDTAPPSPAVHPDQIAGQDPKILETLQDDPQCAEAQLDRGLDESMDASDPPTAVQPGDSGHAMPSTGFDPEMEAKIQLEKEASRAAND